MAKRYSVNVKVISQKGECAAGHKTGDEWVVNGKTPAGMCLSAFSAIYPSLRTLEFGGSFPWAKDLDCTQLACPDAENPVVLELRRIP